MIEQSKLIDQMIEIELIELTDYAALKRDLNYCASLSQKFCLYLKEEELVCNYYRVMICARLHIFGKVPLEMSY